MGFPGSRLQSSEVTVLVEFMGFAEFRVCRVFWV